jgi:hypothetical protein
MDRWYGYKAKSDENWRFSDDFRQGFSYAMDLNDGDSLGAELLLRWLERKTELFVEAEWRRIQRLAAALCDVGKIDGSEIRHVVEGSGGLAVSKTAD